MAVIRITESEHDHLTKEAASHGMSISDYVRPIILNQTMISPIGASAIAELRRLGGLLKHIHNESKGSYSDLTAATIKDLQSCINEIKDGVIHIKKQYED